MISSSEKKIEEKMINIIDDGKFEDGTLGSMVRLGKWLYPYYLRKGTRLQQ